MNKDILPPISDKTPAFLKVSDNETRPLASASWRTKKDIFNSDDEGTFENVETEEAFLRYRIPDHIALARRQQAGTARP